MFIKILVSQHINAKMNFFIFSVNVTGTLLHFVDFYFFIL